MTAGSARLSLIVGTFSLHASYSMETKAPDASYSMGTKAPAKIRTLLVGVTISRSRLTFPAFFVANHQRKVQTKSERGEISANPHHVTTPTQRARSMRQMSGRVRKLGRRVGGLFDAIGRQTPDEQTWIVYNQLVLSSLLGLSGLFPREVWGGALASRRF